MASIKKISRSKTTFWCELGDDAVIFESTSGQYFGLNEVASYIWKNLSVPLGIKELKALVTKEFEVTDEVAEVDIENLVDEMLKRGILVQADA